MNRIKRFAIRAAVHRYGPRVIAAILATAGAALFNLLAEKWPAAVEILNTSGRIAFEDPAWQLTPGTITGFLAFGLFIATRELILHYRNKIIQIGWGDLIADGHLSDQLILSGLEKSNNDAAVTIDRLRRIDPEAKPDKVLAEALIPTTANESESRARKQWLRQRSGKKRRLLPLFRWALSRSRRNKKVSSDPFNRPVAWEPDPDQSVVLPDSNSSFDHRAIDAVAGGVLKSQGTLIVSVAEENEIDPWFLAALLMHETGNGTSRAIRELSNPGGIMDPKSDWQKLMKFENFEAGLRFTARNLVRNYIARGLTTVAEIQKKYAPVGARNDSRDYNRHWVDGVLQWYDAIQNASAG